MHSRGFPHSSAHLQVAIQTCLCGYICSSTYHGYTWTGYSMKKQKQQENILGMPWFHISLLSWLCGGLPKLVPSTEHHLWGFGRWDPGLLPAGELGGSVHSSEQGMWECISHSMPLTQGQGWSQAPATFITLKILTASPRHDSLFAEIMSMAGIIHRPDPNGKVNTSFPFRALFARL